MLLTFFIAPFSFQAQTDSVSTVVLQSRILIKNHFFTTDKLLNIYVISDDDEIIKYNQEGQENYRYSNISLGRASFIDATDPFNLLVFYKDYQTAVLLDRTMSETAVLNLVSFDFFDVKAIGLSSNNNIWIFDELNFRLKKVDRRGEIVQQSDDLSLLLGVDFRPEFLVEREQMVFLNDPNVGILVFDFFGQYIKTIDIKELQNFQIVENRFIFQEDNSLQSFHLKSLLTQPLNLPFLMKEEEVIRVEKGRVFIGNSGSISIYLI